MKNKSIPIDQSIKKRPTLLEKVEQFLSLNYSFRYNEVTGKVEGKGKKQKEFKDVTDYHINSLLREMIKVDIPLNNSLLRNLLISNYTPIFNPFKQYFEELDKWDGETDYIQMLAKTVKTTNDHLWSLCFRKWLVALVGCVLKDDVVNHTAIIFSGKQGLGKTTWLLNLVPVQLKEYSFSGTINPANKDTLIQLSECMLINLDELENLNRSELSMMKEIITKSSIRIRRPYGYSNETIPRRASFVGSVNGKEFLNDTTGNRRFLCFEATGIDYTSSISIDKIYAQALHMFKSGFRYWFDESEIEAINRNNEQYLCMSVEEELLLMNFEPCDLNDATYFFSTTELIDWFSKTVHLNLTDSVKKRLGKALRANHFIRTKRQGRYVYALKQKDQVVEELLTLLNSEQNKVG